MSLKQIFIAILVAIGLVLSVFLLWQLGKQPAATGDWQEHLRIPSTAEFTQDVVLVHNVRNFRYGPTEADMQPDYYDQTYDIDKLKQIWYVTEPFNGQEYAAHTFLSFEFTDGKFLAITIEARKEKDQQYSILKGFLRTYPLIYVAADERDVVLLRANLRNDKVYMYPVKTQSPENAKALFLDMLHGMNEAAEKPVWYNTLFANCTSRIAYHVNRVSENRVPFSWKVWLTGYADQLAYDAGLIDTNLSLEQAREKYLITERSKEVGDVENYSQLIRQFPD